MSREALLRAQLDADDLRKLCKSLSAKIEAMQEDSKLLDGLEALYPEAKGWLVNRAKHRPDAVLMWVTDSEGPPLRKAIRQALERVK